MGTPTVNLKGHNDIPVENLGSCIVYLYNGNKMCRVWCEVADSKGHMILGRKQALAMENTSVSLRSRKLLSKSRQHPQRHVAVSQKPPYKAELERLTELGVIKEVRKHTEWINSIVPVKKPDGSLQLCLDPKDLNQAIEESTVGQNS